MRPSDITIEVRSEALGRLDQIDIDEVIHMRLIKRFNNVGSWQLQLRAEYAMSAVLAQPGRGIIVRGKGGILLLSGNVDNYVKIEKAEDPQGIWEFVGNDDMIHLSDALAWPQPGNSDASTQNTDYDVRTGAAETIMRAYVRYNIGHTDGTASRKITGLKLEPVDLLRGNTVTGRARFDKLGMLLGDIAAKGGGLGFDMKQTSSTEITFSVYEPTDKSDYIQMDVDNDMLSETKYGFGAPTGTRAIVAGQGEGVDRRIIQVTSVDSLAAETAWRRKIEVFKDRRDTDVDAELIEEGTLLVDENGHTITQLSVVPADELTMEYLEDWFLGDIVGVVVDGQALSSVVTEAIIDIDGDGVRVGATIGDPTGFDFESRIIERQQAQESRLAFLEQNVELFSKEDVIGMIEEREYIGTVSSTWTYGKPTVAITGIGNVSAFLPANDIDVQPGASVSLIRSVGDVYTIVAVRNSAPKFLRQHLLTLDAANGWDNYLSGREINSGPLQRYGRATITMSSEGWVILSGMINKVAAAGVTPIRVASFPAAFAPLFPLFIPILNNTATQGLTLEVRTNGEIWTTAASTYAGWISLSGVKWNRLLNYTPLTLLNSWIKFDVNVRTPGIAKDAYNLVNVAGAIKNGTDANPTIIANLAAGFRSDGDMYGITPTMNGASSVPMGSMIPEKSTNTLKKYSPLGTYRTDLDNLVWHEATGPEVYTDLVFQNTWANYSAAPGYSPGSFYLRPDGLVHLRGLVKSGTGIIATLPEGCRPKKTLYILTNAGGVAGSIYIYPNGDIVHTGGTNAYVELSALFAPEQ